MLSATTTCSCATAANPNSHASTCPLPSAHHPHIPPQHQPQVSDQICKLAKKGMTPSAIGVLLRDQHGIPQVHTVTGSKILRVLKGSGLAPDIPEDLYFLIKKVIIAGEGWCLCVCWSALL